MWWNCPANQVANQKGSVPWAFKGKGKSNAKGKGKSAYEIESLYENQWEHFDEPGQPEQGLGGGDPGELGEIEWSSVVAKTTSQSNAKSNYWNRSDRNIVKTYN